MSKFSPTLRSCAEFAWAFHRASSRWPFNVLAPDADEVPEPGKEYLDVPYVGLPDAQRLGRDIETVLNRRRSCRTFSEREIGLGNLATLLSYAIGVRCTECLGDFEIARRPCPSPGALYPLEIYVIARRIEGLAPGIFHYHAQTNSLALVRDGLPPAEVETWLFMNQPYAAEAAAALVLSCVFGRSIKKYRDRGYRYALLEAGHVGQNIALCCSALDIGCCPLGGFFDVALAQLLELDIEEEGLLYAVAVGASSEKATNADTVDEVGLGADSSDKSEPGATDATDP